jgi:hypothetical protein
LPASLTQGLLVNYRLSVLALIAGVFLCACAAQPQQVTAVVTQAVKERCVPTTGSNLCRRGELTGATATITREDLERNPLPSMPGIDPGKGPTN